MLSWGHSWTHSWGHSWVKFRFRLFCASSKKCACNHFGPHSNSARILGPFNERCWTLKVEFLCSSALIPFPKISSCSLASYPQLSAECGCGVQKRLMHTSHRQSLKTLTSLNKEVRPFFISDNSIWSYPSVSSLSDSSIWRSWGLFYPCDHSISSISVHCPQILLSLRKNGIWGVWPPYLRRLRSSRYAHVTQTMGMCP